MIVLNSLFPVFILLVLGAVLKYLKLTNDVFLKTSDKLIYYIFFPAMLFWKIGSAQVENGLSNPLYLAAVSAVMLVFFLSVCSIRLFRVSSFQAGSFVQSSIRFNTYVGVAIIINALGDEGLQYFGVLISIIIPLINLLVIVVLIWHSGYEYDGRMRLRYLLKALISNPLIIGCLLGLIYSRTSLGFPTFLNNTFQLMSMVTLPLALVSIGGVLSYTSLKHAFGLSLLAAFYKLLMLPLIGYGCLVYFGVTGIAFKTGLIFFTLPTSTALYVLSSQLNSDTDLASSAIVLSTILSFVTLSIALLL